MDGSKRPSQKWRPKDPNKFCISVGSIESRTIVKISEQSCASCAHTNTSKDNWCNYVNVPDQSPATATATASDLQQFEHLCDAHCSYFHSLVRSHLHNKRALAKHIRVQIFLSAVERRRNQQVLRLSRNSKCSRRSRDFIYFNLVACAWARHHFIALKRHYSPHKSVEFICSGSIVCFTSHRHTVNVPRCIQKN